MTNSTNASKYHDDTDEEAPTEDVVQVNSYQPQDTVPPSGGTPVPQAKPVTPQMSHPPIPTAGQDF